MENIYEACASADFSTPRQVPSINTVPKSQLAFALVYEMSNRNFTVRFGARHQTCSARKSFAFWFHLSRQGELSHAAVNYATTRNSL
jgi:hypothetical protein